MGCCRCCCHCDDKRELTRSERPGRYGMSAVELGELLAAVSREAYGQADRARGMAADLSEQFDVREPCLMASVGEALMERAAQIFDARMGEVIRPKGRDA